MKGQVGPLGAARRMGQAASGLVRRAADTPGVLQAIAVVLLIMGLYFGYQFLMTVVQKPVEYVRATVTVEIKDKNVVVDVFPSEVGITHNPRFYSVVHSSWNECSDGVRYTVTVDSKQMFGPYCSGIIGAGLSNLLGQKLVSSLVIELPPGTHVFNVVVMGVDDKPIMKIVKVYLPNVAEVKACGGVWPCTGGGQTEQNE